MTAALLLSMLPGCVFLGPRQICRVWADWNTYEFPSLCFERLDHLPYRRPQVETLLWEYGAGPTGPVPFEPPCDPALAVNGAPGQPTPVELPPAPNPASDGAPPAPPGGTLPPLPPQSRPQFDPVLPAPPGSNAAAQRGEIRGPAGSTLMVDSSGRLIWIDPSSGVVTPASAAAPKPPAPPEGAWLFRKRLK